MTTPLIRFHGPLDAPPSDAKVDTSWLRAELVASWREIALIFAIVVGPFILRSNWDSWHGSGSHYLNAIMSQSRLLAGAAEESLLLALFLGYLHRRGWKKSDFKIKAGWRSSVQAILLCVTSTVGNAVTVTGMLVLLFVLQTHYTHFYTFLIARSQHLKPHSMDVSWIVLIGTMILNAFFEELTCTAYAFNQFAAKRGPLFALLLTVLLRMSCHTYQGPEHLLGIGVVFLIYGLWYWWTRNLWVLILAHALLDIASVSFIKAIYG